jgi:hypothetical protein
MRVPKHPQSSYFSGGQEVFRVYRLSTYDETSEAQSWSHGVDRHVDGQSLLVHRSRQMEVWVLVNYSLGDPELLSGGYAFLGTRMRTILHFLWEIQIQRKKTEPLRSR